MERSCLPGSLHSVRTKINIDSIPTSIFENYILSGGYARAGEGGKGGGREL